MTQRLIAGRYRIMELIGSGGMANVYKAYDEEEWRIVALKVLKEEHSRDGEFLRHFQNEARAVLSLSHPNIVCSFDVGEDSGTHFIVLEYVQGSTLKELVQKHGALNPKTAVQLCSQVLGALAHAHQNGFIHRDVKPQNVIVTPSGRVKLTDFGIARDAAATTRTFAGTNVIGSVHYLSPEQARGEEVTAESDIYSCAIMLYEMLTGSVPFAGDNTVAIALKHLQEEIVPPNSVNPRISRALSDVVVKAASKDPRLRYASATEMRTDLHRALREPYGSFARMDMVKQKVAGLRKKTASKSVRLRIAAIALVILLILGSLTALFFSVRAFEKQKELESGGFVVPLLVNKDLDAARELASLRGFILEITEYRSSASVSEGTILVQDPQNGSPAREGDTIRVVVSSGSDTATMPNVLGMDLQAAIDALDLEELRASILYTESDAPAGQVVQQEPQPSTELFHGDTVQIYISGSAQSLFAMPALTGKSYTEAAELLLGNGVKKILVHFDSPSDGSSPPEETVYRQYPAGASSIKADSVAEIWVNRSYRGEFSADIVFNLDNAEKERPVSVTAVVSEGLEVVLYQGMLPIGQQQPVSFTAYLRAEGEVECRAYVEGSLIKSAKIQFAKRENANAGTGH